jgi:hypothetical protein
MNIYHARTAGGLLLAATAVLTGCSMRECVDGSCCFSPDGRLVAYLRSESVALAITGELSCQWHHHSLRWCAADRPEEIERLTVIREFMSPAGGAPQEEVYAVLFSPDGRHILLDTNCGLLLADLYWRRVRRLEVAEDGAHNPVWLSNEQVAYVTSGSDDPPVPWRVFRQDIASGSKPQEIFRGAQRMYAAARWSPDGRFALIEDHPQEQLPELAGVFDLHQGVFTPVSQQALVYPLNERWSEDGETVALPASPILRRGPQGLARGRPKIVCVQAATGQVVPAPDDGGPDLELNVPGSTAKLTCSPFGDLRLEQDRQDQDTEWLIRPHERKAPHTYAKWAVDARLERLAQVCEDGTIRIRDLRSARWRPSAPRPLLLWH